MCVLARPIWTVLAVIAMAGCLSPPSPTGDTTTPPAVAAPMVVPIDATHCADLVLFQLLDFKATEPFLPPGFHARDASELLGNPAVVGKTAMVLVTLNCTLRGQDQPWRPAFLELFVAHPAVPEVNGTARFDFYEVERYGSSNELNGSLRDAGWRIVPADVAVQVMSASGDVIMGSGAVTDEKGSLVTMTGSTPAPLNLDFGSMRFWQQTHGGLGYFETAFPLNPGTGGAACSMRAGSTVAALAGSTTCPPGTPLLASFPDLTFSSHFVYLPGVRAR